MTKKVFSVHIGLSRFEVVERTYQLVCEGKLNFSERVVSSFNDINQATAEMHKRNEELPDQEYLYADERRREAFI